MKSNSLTSLIGSLAFCWSVGQASARGISAVTLGRLAPRLQDGDLIFIRIANPIFRRVAETTGSWENHVGVLFSSPQGTWEVAESTFPFSKFSRLDRFIARSERGRFSIVRHRVELTPTEKAALRKAAGARMGILYDLGFNYDSPRLYCSKFVAQIYEQATGWRVGTVQTFRQLLAANPRAPLAFWRIWFFGFIPWDRRCVTTTSELQSQDFVAVYDSSLKQ